MTPAEEQIERLLSLLRRIEHRYSNRTSWSEHFYYRDYSIVVDEAERFLRRSRRTTGASHSPKQEPLTHGTDNRNPIAL